MGTTLEKDMANYARVMSTLDESSTGSGMGQLQLAGTHWAQARLTHGSIVDKLVTDAFTEAFALLNAGYLKATAAVRMDDAEAKLLMTKWFGARITVAGVPTASGAGGGFDTWQGAKRILGHLQVRLSRPFKLFYRGETQLVGRPTDYPGETGNLTLQDVSGYAESGSSSRDGVIGLCRLFFEKGSKGDFTMNRKGFDSTGGTLAHELSHNYCGTKDHEAVGGGDCYGTSDCIQLATSLPRRAWYNADNIEYFCEEALYGLVASKTTIATGATSSVANLRDAQKALIKAMTPVKPGAQGAPQGGLLQAHQNAVAVANNPTLKPPVQTGATRTVGQLRQLWPPQ